GGARSRWRRMAGRARRRRGPRRKFAESGIALGIRRSSSRGAADGSVASAQSEDRATLAPAASHDAVSVSGRSTESPGGSMTQQTAPVPTQPELATRLEPRSRQALVLLLAAVFVVFLNETTMS